MMVCVTANIIEIIVLPSSTNALLSICSAAMVQVEKLFAKPPPCPNANIPVDIFWGEMPLSVSAPSPHTRRPVYPFGGASPPDELGWGSQKKMRRDAKGYHAGLELAFFCPKQW